MACSYVIYIIRVESGRDMGSKTMSDYDEKVAEQIKRLGLTPTSPIQAEKERVARELEMMRAGDKYLPLVDKTKHKKSRHISTLDPQEREAIRQEMIMEREESLHELLGEQEEDEDNEKELESEEWPEPIMMWHEWTAPEKKFIHVTYKYRNGIGPDQNIPLSVQDAEKYVPRLLDLCDKVGSIGDPSIREDSFHAIRILRSFITLVLGRDPVLDRRRAKDRERDADPARKLRKKELERERNKDPSRKKSRAEKQRKRRFKATFAAAFKDMCHVL